MVPNGRARPYMTVRAQLQNDVFTRIHDMDERLRWIGGLTHRETAARLRLTKDQVTEVTRLDDLAQNSDPNRARSSWLLGQAAGRA